MTLAGSTVDLRRPVGVVSNITDLGQHEVVGAVLSPRLVTSVTGGFGGKTGKNGENRGKTGKNGEKRGKAGKNAGKRGKRGKTGENGEKRAEPTVTRTFSRDLAR